MPKTIEVDFEIGDKVKIIPHEVDGIIVDIWLNHSHIIVQYGVQWMGEGDRIYHHYFPAKELEIVIVEKMQKPKSPPIHYVEEGRDPRTGKK